MIEVANLTKIYKTPTKEKGFLGFLRSFFNRQFKQTKALDNVSFEIGEGEFVGLIGPNGAGKTTTMKILAGVLYPNAGQVKVLGYTPFAKNKDFLRQIAFILGQKNQLIWDLPPTDTFYLNKQIYDIPDKQFDEGVSKLAALLDCKHLLNHPVRTLSLGERMKMELIAGLLHRPKVLFLDEPTIGLDIIAQKTIRDFIKEYQKLYGATIVLTSHYMEDVKQLAKRIMVINLGKIIYDGKLEDVIKKYTKEKTITVILDDQPDFDKLNQIQAEFKLQYPRVVFRVKREKLAETVEKISKNIPFADITIEEERIEDIIRKIFQKKQ